MRNTKIQRGVKMTTYHFRCGCEIPDYTPPYELAPRRCPNHPEERLDHVTKNCLDCGVELTLSTRQTKTLRCRPCAKSFHYATIRLYGQTHKRVAPSRCVVQDRPGRPWHANQAHLAGKLVGRALRKFRPQPVPDCPTWKRLAERSR